MGKEDLLGSNDGSERPAADAKEATIKGSGSSETELMEKTASTTSTEAAELKAAAVIPAAEKKHLQERKKRHNRSEDYENMINAKITRAIDITVTFDDIGALDEIKETLDELIMLPIQRPDLFNKPGGLIKRCRGILLFGPPGTGKTMLAKAIAREAKASFINVCASALASKYFGDSEKIVQALFSVAARISPTIIFIDEVDGLFRRRANIDGHGYYSGRLMNEFMTHWDGLGTRQDDSWILVIGATNRPFDLDEAIIRRFERRVMVGLPTFKDREKILLKIMANENVQQLDLEDIAKVTEGYTGSDLRNLCTAAAYRPLKELIQEERKKKNSEQKQNLEKVQLTDPRPLNMEDFREAMKKVPKSLAPDGQIMKELKRWNQLHGEGGGGCSTEHKEENQQLSYYV